MTLSKLLSIAVAILLPLFLLHCSNNEKNNDSKEHLEIVKLDQLTQEIYKEEKEILFEVKNIQQKMIDTLALSNNPSVVQTEEVVSFNNTIANCDGLIEKHRLLLEQQKEYIDNHENTALGAGDIIAQHKQIKENYSTMNKDLAYFKSVLKEIEALRLD